MASCGEDREGEKTGRHREGREERKVGAGEVIRKNYVSITHICTHAVVPSIHALVSAHLNQSLLVRVEGQWVACGGEGLHNDGLWSRESSPTHCSLQGPVHSTGIHLKQGKTK